MDLDNRETLGIKVSFAFYSVIYKQRKIKILNVYVYVYLSLF